MIKKPSFWVYTVGLIMVKESLHLSMFKWEGYVFIIGMISILHGFYNAQQEMP